MDWRVGDILWVMRPDGERTHFVRVVQDVSPDYLTFRFRKQGSQRMPTERLRKTLVEQWWKDRLISIDPVKVRVVPGESAWQDSWEVEDS